MVLWTGDGTPSSVESWVLVYLGFLLPSHSPCSTRLQVPGFAQKILPSNQGMGICERNSSDGLNIGVRLKGVDLQSLF